ncbi:hypothetical protein F5Y06DRAFT_41794 [Hypoxylon sp. FL0890]|nr:hypothetical protein F5Y06DRAFT_41794 [Hypoxylon sp. FL0890]
MLSLSLSLCSLSLSCHVYLTIDSRVRDRRYTCTIRNALQGKIKKGVGAFTAQEVCMEFSTCTLEALEQERHIFSSFSNIHGEANFSCLTSSNCLRATLLRTK